MKREKRIEGITLIALVITIVVLLILAGVTIITLTGDNGLITKAGNAKEENLKASIKERIQAESAGLEPERQMKSKTDNEIFQLLQGRLDLDDATYEIGSKSMMITTKEGFVFTVLYDGTVKDGKYACLDIADGSIQLKANGYIQGQNQLVEYDGDYIITGTTTENIVEVKEEGTYNITIKDLNIDMRNKNKIAFLAGNIATGLDVNINIEGNNKLIATSTSAISWSNVAEGEEGSTLQFGGKGKLELSCGNASGAMCIGGNNARNITINSGEIYAIRGIECYGTVIGGSNASITINDGNIVASSIKSDALYGNYITINGGKIEAIGGEYGYAMKADEKLVINGGIIVKDTITHGYQHTTIRGKEIEILGGTLRADKRSRYNRTVINCNEGGNIKIKGGTILIIGATEYGIGTFEGSTSVQYIPTDGTNNIYETKIKLNDVSEGKKVTSIVTSDSISYGINDMYTFENGMLYLYLPLGERTITIECDGKTYSGTVETTEAGDVVTLNLVN